MTEHGAPPVDWRNTRIYEGSRVLYHHNGWPRIGIVRRISWSGGEWRLSIRWQEDVEFHNSLRRDLAMGHHLGTSAQIRTTSVTVWPEVTCTHTCTPGTKEAPSGGTGAPTAAALAAE